jgi:ribosomal protein L30E
MESNVFLRDCNSGDPRRRRMMFIDLRILPVLAAAALAVNTSAFSPASAQVQANSWISSWTASPQAPRGVIPASFSNRTIRQIVHLSIGGNKVRLRLSNEFGARPVLIGAASVAIAGGSPGVVSGSVHPVTFGSSKSVIIAPGAPALSDPVEFNVAPLSDVAVSLYLPATTDLGTVHATGLQTAYVRRRAISRQVPNSQS